MLIPTSENTVNDVFWIAGLLACFALAIGLIRGCAALLPPDTGSKP